MKRIGILIAALVSLAPCAAAPALAAEVDARVVSLTSINRPDLVDYTRVTYDPETRVARIYLTAHCFVERLQIDPDGPVDVGQSQVLSIDNQVTQRGRQSEYRWLNVIALDPDVTQCHRDFIVEIPDLKVGVATIRVIVWQMAWHDVMTETTLRAILPPH